MRLFSFGSGSSGNAFLLETAHARVLIDCGIGIRRLRRALGELGAAGKLDAVFLTHEHIDHVRALDSLRRNETCRVYASAGTFGALGRDPDWVTVGAGVSTAIGDLSITPVNVSHDASEPYGYVVQDGTEKIAFFTDLGEPDATICAAITDATVVVLEANYCEAMLRHSRYPPHLKRRIRGPLGHLSNDDCAATLATALTPSVRTVWLAHLSENNNTPETAVSTIQDELSARGIGLPVQALPRHDTADLLVPANAERTWQTSLLG